MSFDNLSVLQSVPVAKFEQTDYDTSNSTIQIAQFGTLCQDIIQRVDVFPIFGIHFIQVAEQHLPSEAFFAQVWLSLKQSLRMHGLSNAITNLLDSHRCKRVTHKKIEHIFLFIQLTKKRNEGMFTTMM